MVTPIQASDFKYKWTRLLAWYSTPWYV